MTTQVSKGTEDFLRLHTCDVLMKSLPRQIGEVVGNEETLMSTTKTLYAVKLMLQTPFVESSFESIRQIQCVVVDTLLKLLRLPTDLCRLDAAITTLAAEVKTKVN